MLVKSAYDGNLQEADNSVGIVYMVINVFCKEFLMQKARIVITNYIHHSFSYREKERKISRIFFADLRICGINE